MNRLTPVLPVFAIERHRLTTDGKGVTTLVGSYGCPLACKYCINPHAWNPKIYEKCHNYTPQELYEILKIDNLYFLATGGGVTFGGGESLLHAEFISHFKKICGAGWNLTVETSLNVPEQQLRKALVAADDFIVDIKALNPAIYEAYTGVPMERALANLKILAKHKTPEHIHVRVPIIPEFSTKEQAAASVKTLKEMGFTDIEVFPYIIPHPNTPKCFLSDPLK